MGFQTQSVQSGQAYPIASVNAVTGIGETSLARQKSIYSLTLEEFRNTLGEPSKSFGSMNVDELLKNIWTAEESQAMLAAVGTLDVCGTSIPKQASLCRQGSIALRNGLGQKTVDEEWKTIYQEHNDMGSSKGGQQKTITFGEMTLEDFLLKAAVAREGENAGNEGEPSTALGGTVMTDREGQFGAGISTNKTVLPNLHVGNGLRIDAVPGVTTLQPAHLLKDSFQKSSVQLQQQRLGQLSQPPGTVELGAVYSNCGKQAGNCSLVAAAVGLGGLASPVGGGIAASLSTGLCYGYNEGMSLNVAPFKAEPPYSPSINCAVPCHDNVQLSPSLQPLLDVSVNLRKIPAEGAAQRAMERRQRRMIKNRESASRSRARKQAYTVELEEEVTQLKAENLKLRQKQAEAERRKKQVMAIMPSLSREAQSKKKVLRRTQTGPWADSKKNTFDWHCSRVQAFILAMVGSGLLP